MSGAWNVLPRKSIPVKSPNIFAPVRLAPGVATTEAGVAGLLVIYDPVGDHSVFLAHVTKLGASDIVFA